MTSTSFLALVAHDARLQWRYGIYAAYGFVIAFYIAGLWTLGGHLPAWFIAIVIYTDPAVVGFFFLGALMMLEKAETVRRALAVTPLSAHLYVLSKLITLTGMAVIAVVALVPFVHASPNVPLLIVATVLTSVAFLGLGVPAALFFRTVTSYLIGAAGWMVPLTVPAFLAFLNPMPGWVILVPTASQLRLILVGLGAAGASPGEIAAMLAVSTLAATGAVYWAVRRLQKELGVK